MYDDHLHMTYGGKVYIHSHSKEYDHSDDPYIGFSVPLRSPAREKALDEIQFQYDRLSRTPYFQDYANEYKAILDYHGWPLKEGPNVGTESGAGSPDKLE